MLNAHERETVINLCDGEPMARISTAQRPWIRRLKKNPACTLVSEGEFEGSPWAEFIVPAKLIQVRRPRVMTEEQRRTARANLVARLAAKEDS